MTRISVSSSGEQGNNNSVNPTISADGRYVAFQSYATNLVPEDTNGWPDIFVHDSQTGITTLVSVDSNGVQSNGVQDSPKISADGQHIAFSSNATNLVPDDTNGVSDVFVHDMQTGITKRASVTSIGAQANSVSDGGVSSGDGRYIAFRSYATNLVSGDTNGLADIFIHDMQSGITTRVSVASDGTQANDVSNLPSISADGRYIAFVSYATNLVPIDTSSSPEVFVHDLQTGFTTRIAVDPNGLEGNAYSSNPSISGDGRYIAFYSDATNLVPGDTNVKGDIFVRDTWSNTTTRVSVSSNGEQADDASSSPCTSLNGQHIAFISFATNLVTGDTNGVADAFVHRIDVPVAPVIVALTYVAGPGGTLIGDTSQTIDYGGDGTEVTAMPEVGYHFDDWSDGSTANPRTDTNVTADLNVTANFALDEHTLTVVSAHGTVTKNPDQATYHLNDQVQLTAVPESGWSFVNWSGDVSDTANPIEVMVTGDLELTANYTQDKSWNTFLGGSADDKSYGMATDENGNTYVAGPSSSTWGDPVRAYSASTDGFVAKLDPSGNLVWNTFLGGFSTDSLQAITVDQAGNIYVIGYSLDTWGNPLRPPSGDVSDFIAKLDVSGNLLWHTFIGPKGNYVGSGIVADQAGNIYVNTTTRQSPMDPSFSAVSKLDSSGGLVWHTVLGMPETYGHGIALDESGDVIVTGYSQSTWGNPIHPYAGAIDGFVAKLDNSSGSLLWNTFFGSNTGRDVGYGITLDESDNIYVTGHSTAAWGAPVRAYTGDQDGIVLKLDSSGQLLWNTFLGGTGTDYNGYEIELDGDGNIYVAGGSNAAWGTPVRSYTGYYDASIVELDSTGKLLANSFLGGSGDDRSYGIALEESGDILVTGYSDVTWGGPLRAYTAGNDAFVTKTSLEYPNSILVTTLADSGPGSLRQAIADASSGDAIWFHPSLAGGTIPLASTLTIDKDLTIDGSSLASHVHISGDTDSDGIGDVSIFQITTGSTVELDGLDIVRGQSTDPITSGGINNSGDLTLDDCSFSENRGDQGGAIHNFGSLTVSNCTFSYNTAIDGGAIFADVDSIVSISHSTFINNTAGR